MDRVLVGSRKQQLSGFCLEWEQISPHVSSSRKARKNSLEEEKKLHPPKASVEANQTDASDDEVQSRLMSTRVCVRK